MEKRYLRNLGVITEEEQNKLSSKKVLIVGAGGLGGYVAEYLARLGVGSIGIADGDVFDETNLNRQLLSSQEDIGKNKALCAKMRILSINSAIAAVAYDCNLNAENAGVLLASCDLAIDALDSVEARLILESAAAKADITLLHAAVSGLQGQVMTVPAGSGLLAALYEGAATEGKPSVTAYSAAVIAGYEAAEAVNVLLDKPKLSGKLLVIDIDDFTTEILNLR